MSAATATDWRTYLEWADENDDCGGHVGLSRYYRERAWQLQDAERERDRAAAEHEQGHRP